MPSHPADAAPDVEQTNPYASASRWRHQESTRYARHAAHRQDEAHEPTAVGEGEAHGNGKIAQAADDNAMQPDAQHEHEPSEAAAVDGGKIHREISDGRLIVCGPLLNYRRTEEGDWCGSVLIVVEGGGQDVIHPPVLVLQKAGEAALLANSDHRNGDNDNDNDGDEHNDDGRELRQGRAGRHIQGERLYSDPRATFWRFDIRVPIAASEIEYEYTFPDMRFSGTSTSTFASKPSSYRFFVPAASESMRIMFYSCNGFSVGTDEKAWSGQALWNDVLRKHKETPFHVMIGGGDQIYNDGIRVDGPLRAWTDIGSPIKRQEYHFPVQLRADCDDYYLNNYIRWYSSGPFSVANGQIPQVNIWDDHDIIDGFGSYVDLFNRCNVFRGIGGTAHKYYMLFQHHLPPPQSTYTSDHSPDDGESQGVDPKQLVDTYVAPPKVESQYIIGKKPGPYLAELSHNLFTRLGARMALLGLDARTERTRHQINYPETYELVFQRTRSELAAAASSGQPIKHLILLLGIPIAYPRLTWLENILRSPVIGPVKFLSKRFGVGGGLFNHFDGSVDLLDDLDDHYTARTHKAERSHLIESLQAISAEFSVRITILGGDVHLAALGRFYSSPWLQVPVEQDHRYMANVISSAIVNKPPPQGVANLLARRNKIHHLNRETDETMLDLFDKDPGESSKTANHNSCTMPSRNYAMLTENSPGSADAVHGNGTPGGTGNGGGGGGGGEATGETGSFAGTDGHSELHDGEVGCGTKHRAAADGHGKGSDGGLDVRINVEIDQHDDQGRTEGYGLTIPLLSYRPKTGGSTAADGVAV